MILETKQLGQFYALTRALFIPFLGRLLEVFGFTISRPTLASSTQNLPVTEGFLHVGEQPPGKSLIRFPQRALGSLTFILVHHGPFELTVGVALLDIFALVEIHLTLPDS